MNTLDHSNHKLGAVLVCRLGTLSIWIKGKRFKRIVSNLIALVLGVILAEAILYQLPNAIAGFIYGTHQTYIPKKFPSEK